MSIKASNENERKIEKPEELKKMLNLEKSRKNYGFLGKKEQHGQSKSIDSAL